MTWMPAVAGEKITLGITIVLSCSVFQLVIAQSIPRTSDYFPVIMIYVAFIMCMAVVSTVNAIIILHLNFHPSKNRPSNKLRVFLFEYVAKVLCMYSSVPHEEQDDETRSSTTMAVPAKSPEQGLAITDLVKGKKVQPAAEYYPENGNIKRIAEGGNEICDSIRNKATLEHIQEEWKGVARVLDRIFFWICLLTVICACSMFSNRDSSHPGTKW